MSKPFILDSTFSNENYTQNRLPRGEYENCIFERCNFENSLLDNQNFMECTFIECNLSSSNITNTIFKEVSFVQCKMLGIPFESCNTFLIDFTFDTCVLNLSSFYGLTLKNQFFKGCTLKQVDFTETQLSEVIFSDCDLEQSIFDRTLLQKADLSTAYNYTIDPAINNITKAIFSKEGISGLLTKHNIVIK
ncbi:pentapeptide repeat-containing protein [uncultured Maribacter sp.]|uniref:pentapeptide repeat-containing protein n=1 Tax=uncultured Maribacter sp. TaxID=431308 RepID=UPI00262488A1|nr:pentapeptide repeat-containing protein [uncultured Maribacter sp.]